jgi:PAS domain S-box-containing protein
VKLIDHTFAHIFWDLQNAQDIQKRQMAELKALDHKIESERRTIQNLFDSLPDLVVVLDKDRKIIRTNARFAEFTGMAVEKALGKRCCDIFRDTEMAVDCRSGACAFDRVYSSGQVSSLVHRSPPPEETYWELTQTPILNEEGQTEGVIETWHRITETVMLRREIEHAEQRFTRFIDSARDHISIKDLEGRYVAVNERIAQIYNREKEEFVGKKVEEMLPRGIAMIVNHHDREVIKKNAHRTYEEIFQIDGRDRHFHTVRFPLTNHKGEPTHVCTIARDVTMRKELQDQLVQSAKLVAVGKLAAGVAHEINNPLTGILAYAEDISDEMDVKNPLHEDMKVIIRETLRCRDIVRNLLDFARQDQPKFETVNPNDVVEQSLILVEKLPRFKDIVIQKELEEKISSIQADPRQLQQVVLNFILNAADAMEGKGTIILTTEEDRRTGKCIISVEDTGPGIPENLIDKVFEPFFSSKGTSGLGLAVSWGIVERHRGVIEVDTAESEGAIFRIILPAVREGGIV